MDWIIGFKDSAEPEIGRRYVAIHESDFLAAWLGPDTVSDRSEATKFSDTMENRLALIEYGYTVEQVDEPEVKP